MPQALDPWWRLCYLLCCLFVCLCVGHMSSLGRMMDSYCSRLVQSRSFAAILYTRPHKYGTCECTYYPAALPLAHHPPCHHDMYSTNKQVTRVVGWKQQRVLQPFEKSSHGGSRKEREQRRRGRRHSACAAPARGAAPACDGGGGGNIPQVHVGSGNWLVDRSMDRQPAYHPTCVHTLLPAAP